jgi:hypothetical protein
VSVGAKRQASRPTRAPSRRNERARGCEAAGQARGQKRGRRRDVECRRTLSRSLTARPATPHARPRAPAHCRTALRAQDFFVQMAIQLAYHRLHGDFVATYETGHTRAFYHGRTETIRACSLESVAFCQAMASPVVAAEERFAALRTAIKAHGEYAQLALSGRACDRHLLGLYIVAHLSGMSPRPAIFTDPAYKKSGGGGNFLISTSNVGYTPLFGGFAPMSKDGYGACYSILEGRINISTSSWNTCAHTDCQKFGEQLIRALIGMQQLCIAANPPLAQPSKL